MTSTSISSGESLSDDSVQEDDTAQECVELTPEQPDSDPRQPRRGLHRRRRPKRPISRRHRLIRRVVLGVLAIALVLVSISLGMALTNPALGGSVSARFAEWARDHGGASVVNWVENEWYKHHPPKVGGAPPKGAIVVPPSTTTTSLPAVSTVTTPPQPTHLAPPAPVAPFASPALAGEGQWTPSGRTVDGLPGVYETTLRPDAVHTSYVVGVAWMDTKLLSASLYSGSQIPGGGPYTHTAPVSATAQKTMVAAFNAGFLMKTANGGYYTDGKTEVPLRTGAASFVVYKDGSSTVGQWGTDVTMTPDVVSVRQNLDLLVENGQPVAGLNSTTTTKWGFTLGNAVYVWRSGLGVTADGALVYVGGPGLNITDLADILARAGAVRAMELDINTTWVNYSTYTPAAATGPAAATNGHELLPQMAGTPGRYFESYWGRDFITMSANPTFGSTPSAGNTTVFGGATGLASGG